MSEEPQTSRPVPVIVHLSGARRGTTQRLQGDTLRIGTAPEVEVHVAHEPSVASHHATLVRRDATYQLHTRPEHPVWVNGKVAEDRDLESGDVLEIGRDGPLLRFRLYPPGSRAYKSPAEAFSDSVECARHGAETPVGRAAVLLAGTPRELATQTSIGFRSSLILLLFALAMIITLLGRAYFQLENRLAREELRLRGISELVATSDAELTPEDLAAVRQELTTAIERVEALEAREDAPARVVASSSRSVVLLQGAYGFVEPESQLWLRFGAAGPEGQPARGPDGSPVVELGGEGPLLEIMFTGTGFVASSSGLLLTNRHVALPWVYDNGARMLMSQGLVPVMNRFLGFLPAIEEPFDVELVLASDDADLAVLVSRAATAGVDPLAMRDSPPAAGEEVIVLGYPTGIRALLARADEAFVNELEAAATMDFWTVARRLSAAGYIAPLASRGIVAQVNPTAVVYDAETTRGGSGGPVLDLDGRVVAVTSAIVPEFGGSNLGVPASRGSALLWRATFSLILPFSLR